MPKFLKSALRHEATKKGLTGEAADRYVFGGLNNIGAMHGSKETAKGRAMEAKHAADHPRRRAPKHDGPPNYTKHLARKHKD